MGERNRHKPAQPTWKWQEVPVLDETLCTGCGRCVALCPTDCLSMAGPFPWMARPAACVSCAVCVAICPAGALKHGRSWGRGTITTLASLMHESPDPEQYGAARFRWQTLFQEAAEPVFFLNRRRCLLFVNRAWEVLTGLSAAEVKGQVCRRCPRGILAERLEIILGALAPPPEVSEGRPSQARRLLSTGAAPVWWHIAFFPLAGHEGLLGVLGKITALPRTESVPIQPLSEKISELRQRHVQGFRLDELVGEGPAMSRVREQVRLAANTRLPILLVGAKGTGKHWLARAIHHLGPESDKPCARVDGARLHPDSLATLLFASGTLQPASIYLQNADCLPRDLQERLVQRLETGAGARILAGVTKDPRALVHSGQFLQELYCRLSALVLEVPPLQERMDDFDAWGERLLARAQHGGRECAARHRPRVLVLLRTHAWPGNLQELYEVLMGACLRAKGTQVEPGDLPFHLRQVPLPPEKPLALDAILEQVERRLIVHALRLAKNNKSRAAELLTIWRARLLRRMENLAIKDQE